MFGDADLSVAAGEEVRCVCGRVVAIRLNGFVRVSGTPLLAIAAICPDCGESVALMGGPGELEISKAAAARLTLALDAIRANGGFGTLLVRFQKGRARYVGLGECLGDVLG